MSLFITIGIVLLILCVLFALPGLGIGLIIPVLGDAIDIPISFFFAFVGVIFLLIGGVLWAIATYWWLLLLGIIVYVIIISIKSWRVYTRKGRRTR
jgi:hypothetical protein